MITEQQIHEAASVDYHEKEDATRFEAFIAGANWMQEQNSKNLRPIKPSEGMPPKPGKQTYEHVQCLIRDKCGIRILMWNCEHLCWDEEDGDDYECDADAVEWYIPMDDIMAIINI